MNAKEEITKLLMESYDQGVKDGLQTSLQIIKERRTWVGLTDEEMMEAIHMDDSPMEMGRKIEAKLKEKNT
jgi:hypothetical protein